MLHRRRTLVATTVLLASMALVPMGSAPTTTIAGSAQGAEEAQELRTTARARLAAQHQAERQGIAPVDDSGTRHYVPTPGWSKEKVFSKYNDWEPAAAADPSSGYVYMITTAYGAPKACGTCPGSPSITMRISTDGGHSFGPMGYLCPCAGKNWQADPQIETDDAGNVYAAWLTNPFGTVFSKSTDMGQTWTPPIRLGGSLAWDDHPWLVVSPDGMDVYVGFNKSDNYQVASHDGGATFSAPLQTNTDDDYYFSEGGTVLPDDTVVFSASAFAPNRPDSVAPVDVYAIRSTDGGTSWTQTKIAVSKPIRFCRSYRCPHYQYGAQASVDSDAAGNLLMAYNAAKRKLGGQRIFVVTSTDSGASWSAPTPISPGGDVNATFPQVAGRGTGFSIAWADNRNGPGNYNTYERETTDLGASFTPVARLSNLGHGASYKDHGGYQFSYGDYFDLAINNVGETFVVWGESDDYWGPGGTWYGVET